MHKLILATMIFSFVGATAQVSTVELDKQHLLRRIRFGYREIHLPQQLHNDELRVTNDQLNVKIANLQGGEPDTNHVLIDQYVTDETKAAIKDAKVFAQMYHLSSSPTPELVDLESRLDSANEKCHPRDADQPVVFTSMREAQSACSELSAISTELTALHFVTPQEWVSVYDEDPGYRTRTGYKFFVADTKQMKLDEASHINPKAKKFLLRNDGSLLDDDRQIWLAEMSEQDTLEFNVKHPESLMADSKGILEMLTKFRQDLANILIKLRKESIRAS
jgi:hypothetical protein